MKGLVPKQFDSTNASILLSLLPSHESSGKLLALSVMRLLGQKRTSTNFDDFVTYNDRLVMLTRHCVNDLGTWSPLKTIAARMRELAD